MPRHLLTAASRKALSLLLEGRTRKGRGPAKVLAISLAALLFAGASLSIAAPASLMAASASGEASGELEDIVISYGRKAEELEAWARQRWSSGTGEDSYSTPDWRYLYAFDMAVSECDEHLIEDYEEHYRGLHRDLLKASSSVRYRYVEAKEDTPGAQRSKEDGKYYVLEPYTVWTVTYAPLEQAFGEVSPGTLSAEFRYFALRTGASYADAWTADGKRAGFYRMRAGSELADFAAFAVRRDPDTFSMFSAWEGEDGVEAGDVAFARAWELAWEKDPDAFAALQDDFFAETALIRAASALRLSCGVELAGYRECVQGLFAGAAAELSDEELSRALASLDAGASEAEIAEALCDSISLIRPDLSLRYLAERQAVLDLLASSPDASGEGLSEAEGRLFDAGARSTLAVNYYASLKTVQVDFADGEVSVSVDAASLAEAVSSAAVSYKATLSAYASDAVNAAMGKIGCAYVWGGEGPDGFDCSGLVTWAYRQVGIEVGHYTVTQYESCEIVSEDKACPGDLVFQLFGGSTHTPAGFPSHVGIYIGGGKMVHAPTFGALVRIDDVRVFDVNPVFGRLR